ncbi:MAG: ACT domain-containing protein [Planctomycetes bacterium]|nr:ACT domain-containing protein [Planctomycetota bacterium]
MKGDDVDDDVAAALVALARAGDPGRLRAGWREALAALPPGGGPGDPDPGGGRARAALTDVLVRALLEASGAADAVTCLALGGYGRRELAPHSDIDLLVLRETDGADDPAIEGFVRLLWDAGAQVGHAVRTLDGAAQALGRDLAGATATLEGRLVAGRPAGLAALRGVVADFLARDRDRFVQAKLAEADERHRAHGDTVMLLTPDLKAGRGTARDLQLARLLAALVAPVAPADDDERVLPALAHADAALAAWLELAPDEVAGLDAAGRLLLACRAAVHELSSARGDRLELDLQEAVARRFGHEARGGRLPVEVFMDEVYRAARLVDRVLARCRLRLAPPGPPRRARPLATGVASVGDEVVLDPPAPTAAATLAELFRQALRGRRRLTPRTLEEVRRAVDALGPAALRADVEVARGFREVLGGVKGVAQVVRAMHEAGYLGAVMPEVGALECLSQADPYHAYTVDEHTLAVMRALEGPLAGAPEREDELREELLHRTTRRDLLRLGVLLHDAGKVGGAPGHTERGAALVPTVAWRLGLSTEEERHVRFLVQEHLTMSRMAEKRDVDAPATVDDLLAVAGRDAERLEHLYLLTVADVRGVSPRAMTRWKDHLLTRLYGHAREALERGGAAPRGPATREEWLALLGGRADPAALEAHLARCGRAYLADVEPDEVLLHLDLAAGLERAGAPQVRCSLDEGCERVWVAARDRAGLFADLCGALTGSGYEILSVTTFARADGVVFDRFAVQPGGAEPAAARWPRLEATIGDVLAGRQAAADLLARRRRREPARPARPRPPVRVRLDDGIAPDLTVVDVSAPDRVGLLHDLARALSAAGCDIRLAKVATKGDRAVDVFHVTGPDGRPLDARARDAVAAALRAAAAGTSDAAPGA